MNLRGGLILLCFLFLVDIVAIGFFAKGFFLTRMETNEEFMAETIREESQKLLSPSLQRLFNTPSSKYSKFIWIVIDAFRFDFAMHNEEANNIPTSSSVNNHTNTIPQHNEFYHNQFTLIKELLHSPETASHCLLYKFIADSPTVTMQRLKALTTGSIPTFIDINDIKFESAAIHEDNLIKKWKQANKQMILLGDDTWVQLYPNYFDKSLDYPSFDATDIHTVDNGIIDHLLEEVNQFDILIAHFLGVDHVGHRYGPNHPAMRAKLNQLDQVLRQVIDKMDENTLFFILGDHGMTEDGNHGGATKEETDATLFIYSKNQLLQHKKSNQFKSIHQIDLVPSLSLLSGVEIPFGNLGSIIPDLFFPFSDDDCVSSDFHEILYLLSLYQRNAYQIMNYLQYYSSISSQFSNSYILSFKNKFEKYANTIELLINQQKEDKENQASMKELCNLSLLYKSTFHDIFEMCREKWAQFDLFSMQIGICFLFLSCFILSVFIVVNYFLFDEFSLLFYKSKTSARTSSSSSSSSFYVLFTFCFTICMVLCFLSHCFGQFTNSYIEMDQKVVSFLLSGGIGFFIIYNQFSKQNTFSNEKRFYYVCILLLCIIRFTSESFLIGRHENILKTSQFHFNTIDLLFEFLIIWGSLIVCLFIFHKSLIFRYFRRFLKISQIIQMICIGSFWMLKSYVDKDDPNFHSFVFLFVYLPRIVYMLAFFQFLYIFLFPSHCEFVQFHSFIWKIPNFYIDPYFTGFFLNFLIILWFLLAMLSGPAGSISLACLLIQILLFLQISKKCENSFFCSLGDCIFLSFMSLQYFFSTGHDWQLSSLQFETAFIGFDNFNWLAGFILMMLNTFSSPFFIIFSIPLFIKQIVVPVDSKNKNNFISSFFSLHCKYLKAILYYKLFSSWHMLLNIIFVYIERRHLMVWRVFAPKFLIESVYFITIDILLIACLSVILFLRLKFNKIETKIE